MKIAGQSVRQSSKYISKEINGTLYIFEADTYVDKSKVYSFIRKAISGKVELDQSKHGVTVFDDGSFKQEVL